MEKTVYGNSTTCTGDLQQRHQAVAIIIAAGFGTRMGGMAKALLRIGYETAIERVCGTYEACGVKPVVVLGSHHDEITPLLDILSIDYIMNTNPKRGMFSSILTGLHHESTVHRPFFIHPVDIPLVSTCTINSLLAQYTSMDEDSGHLIIAPSFNNQRGHPPLFLPQCRSMFLDLDPETDNLRDFQNRRLKRTLWVICDDTGMFTDMDSPEDFRAINKDVSSEGWPSEQAALNLLGKNQPNEHVRHHSLAVADVCEELAERNGLSEADVSLLRVSAIVHDIKKGTPFHDREGAALLRKLGFNKVAALIRTHMNYLPLSSDNREFSLPLQPPSEREYSSNTIHLHTSGKPDLRAILFLGDKLIKDSKRVTVEEKFFGSQKKFSQNPAALAAVQKRKKAAEKIERTLFKEPDA